MSGTGHALRRGWRAAVVLLACACTPSVQTTRVPIYPVEARAERPPGTVTFLLPGALSTSHIFGPARDWSGAGNLVVEYRLPGMQGEPLDPPLAIGRAADWVAAYANRYPEAQIRILGFSTGAAIAIEAAGRISDSARVRVAAVSSATPFPGAVVAAARGGIQVAGSVLATGSLDRRTIWEDNFKTLYFGTGWRRTEEGRRAAARLVEGMRSQIVIPGGGRGRAQSASLLFWTLSPRARDTDATVVFFHGERDPVFPLASVRRLAESLRAPLCVLPGGGHLVFESDRDLIERIERFFSGDTGGAPCG